jgi:hypothetical protein
VSAQSNKELVRRLVEEGVRERDLRVLDEVAAGTFAEVAKRWIAPFRDGRLVSALGVEDNLSRLRQLGIFPEPS